MFVLTIFIAYYSKKSSKASLEAAQLAKKEYESKKEPEIIIYFELNEFRLDFKLKNIGNGVATNVIIKLEEKSGNFHNSYMHKMENGIFNTSILTFAPSQEIKGIAAEVSDIKGDSGYPVFTCNINYHDKNGRLYNKSYDFDLNYIAGLVWTKKATLDKVAESLKGIEKEIKKLHSKS
ncbi:hypothetical protein NQS36_16890 [Bacillus sp. C1(2022)]|nr:MULTISPECIES: hypothetical protein [Bacillus]AMR10756.1 hypothetical protein AB684_11380 [Bacillus licheniformis]EFV72305.1 hypothetical protein HMPREF1012_01022 [Bacillus sp. BT1B_CT2]KJH58722.1 hypothetical protein UF14_09960 [Bacillus licheniformis]MCM3374166.1 hypothetical protein [Bacillus licheniformis]MCM3433587.1 hypothetical protein [Bacillus licheniformis]